MSLYFKSIIYIFPNFSRAIHIFPTNIITGIGVYKIKFYIWTMHITSSLMLNSLKLTLHNFLKNLGNDSVTKVYHSANTYKPNHVFQICHQMFNMHSIPSDFQLLDINTNYRHYQIQYGLRAIKNTYVVHHSYYTR